MCPKFGRSNVRENVSLSHVVVSLAHVDGAFSVECFAPELIVIEPTPLTSWPWVSGGSGVRCFVGKGRVWPFKMEDSLQSECASSSCGPERVMLNKWEKVRGEL